MFLKKSFNVIVSYLILDSKSSSLLHTSTFLTWLWLPISQELLSYLANLKCFCMMCLLSFRPITLVSSLMPLCKKCFLVESLQITWSIIINTTVLPDRYASHGDLVFIVCFVKGWLMCICFILSPDSVEQAGLDSCCTDWDSGALTPGCVAGVFMTGPAVFFQASDWSSLGGNNTSRLVSFSACHVASRTLLDKTVLLFGTQCTSEVWCEPGPLTSAPKGNELPAWGTAGTLLYTNGFGWVPFKGFSCSSEDRPAALFFRENVWLCNGFQVQPELSDTDSTLLSSCTLALKSDRAMTLKFHKNKKSKHSFKTCTLHATLD